jgi:hypothetical protein
MKREQKAPQQVTVQLLPLPQLPRMDLARPWDPLQGDIAVTMMANSAQIAQGPVLPYDERPMTPPKGQPALDFRMYRSGPQPRSQILKRQNIRITTPPVPDARMTDANDTDSDEESNELPDPSPSVVAAVEAAHAAWTADEGDASDSHASDEECSMRFNPRQWAQEHARATAVFVADHPRAPLPVWPLGFYFSDMNDFWPAETGPPEWTTRRGLLQALDGYPGDPIKLPWPWHPRELPKELGLDLCPAGSKFWPREIMDDIPRHARNLERKFGVLSHNHMVVFRGTYDANKHRQDTQVFHHIFCRRLFTGPGLNQGIQETDLNSCYKKGTQLCQVKIVKQFKLRMCRYCAKKFTNEQQLLWNKERRPRP